MSAARHLFLIAGEPSGDRLGASLMAGLKRLDPDLQFHGIGGHLMQAQGLHSLFPMSDLSVMGIAEVLPRLPKLLRRVREAATAASDLNPAALITIDSPDFCLRVAARAKVANPGLKTIHYVAPTVWAWRPERAAKMAKYIGHVLALFPFEPPFMQVEGMGCDFVGHPVVADPVASKVDIGDFRASHGIAQDAPLLAVLPGSRQGEINRIGPVFAAALELIHAKRPDIRFVVPAATNVAQNLKAMIESWPAAPILLDPREMFADAAEARKRVALAASDLALAASGTVSLELAAARTPMVIAYKFNWLTTRILKRKVKVDTATLVNLLTETRTIPEFLFENCTPSKIADAVLDLMNDENARLAQVAIGDQAMVLLGKGSQDPGLRAARAVLDVIATP